MPADAPIFDSKAIHRIVKDHEDRMSDALPETQRMVATYMTRFWREYDSTSAQSKSGTEKAKMVGENTAAIEVNRLWPAATTMLSALYPRAARATCQPDYSGVGDAQKAQAALNDWLLRAEMQDRVLHAVRQVLLSGLVAFKVCYQPGTGRPTDRTQVVVCPRWEVVLDYKITDVSQERYRGHLHWRQRKEVEAAYGVDGLVGTTRKDQMASDDAGAGAAVSAITAGPASDDDWVQVLEFYNFVDPITTKGGRTYQGRMDVFVLGQPDGRSNTPITSEPMPFSKPGGEPLSPLVPVILASHPFYPYVPISVFARLMPQIKELNVFRTAMAAMARRSMGRKGMARGNAVSADVATKLMDGTDTYVGRTDDGYAGPLADAMQWFDPPKIDPMMRDHIAAVAGELQQVLAQAPATRGEITDATKYEVQAASRYTDAELHMYAQQLYNALSRVGELALRAFIDCMQDVSDSTGGYAPAGAVAAEQVAGDVHVAAVGAVRDDTVPAPTSPEPTAGLAPAKPARTAQDRPFKVKADGATVEVRKEDIDATFEIQFVDGVRTPMKEDARKQAQLQLGDKMMQLWGIVLKGGPPAILARVQMTALCEAFDLPADWRPEALEEAMKREAPVVPPKPPPTDDVTAIGAAPALESQAPPPVEPEPELRPPAPAEPNEPPAVNALLAAKKALEEGDEAAAAQIIAEVVQKIPQMRVLFGQAAEQGPEAVMHLIDTIVQQLGAAPPPAAEA